MRVLFFWTVLFLIAAMFSPAPAPCGEVLFMPSISVKEEYNDNILFTSSDRTRSFITTISPGLEYRARTERGELGLLGRVDVLRYTDESAFDTEDQYYSGRFAYRITQGLGLSADGAFSRSSRPDRDIETTGIILGTVRRDRWNGGASADWTISERLAAGLSYFYENDRYDSPTVSDFEGHNAGIGFTRVLTPTLKGRFNAGYANYRYPELSNRTESYSATVGVEKAAHEKWNLIVDAGGRFTRSEYPVQEPIFVPPFSVTTDKTSETWGGVGKVVFSYRGEGTTVDFSAGSDLAAASGRSSPVQRTSFTVSARQRLSWKLRAYINAGYFINHAGAGDYGLTAIDEETASIAPGLRYEFSRDMALDLFYAWGWSMDKSADTEAYRNLIFLRFWVQHRLLE